MPRSTYRATTEVPAGLTFYEGTIRLEHGEETHSDQILVVDTLTIDHYQLAAQSVAVICEDCQPTNHMTVVCRILGIPVVRVDSATRHFTTGQTVRVDLAHSEVSTSDHDKSPANPRVPPPLFQVAANSLRFQVSIVNEPRLIDQINDSQAEDVEQFFLRSELLWLSRRLHPIDFFSRKGESATVDMLHEALNGLVTRLRPDQFLNFRGLDLRTDQNNFGTLPRAHEPNPQLGLHGTRHLLAAPDYLAAELRAVDRLYAEGHKNVIYSLPFLALSSEFESVSRIRDASCMNDLRLGAFVETPAAVYEIDRLLDQNPAAIYLGTKDLAQLIMAADRDNSAVVQMLGTLQPPVLHAIRKTVRASRARDVPAYVFSLPADLVSLIGQIPEIDRVSLAASDYLLGLSAPVG